LLLLLFHQNIKTSFVHSHTAFPGHQLGEVERETLLVIKPKSDCPGDLGSAPAPGAGSRALAGTSGERARPGRTCRRLAGKTRGHVRSPKPGIILRQRNDTIVPGISTDIMEFLLQVRIAAN